MQFLREYELGGILADDMGLGKTIQTLVHLTVEKRAGRMRHPSLIVAPTSLMGNWRREATMFAPRLKVLVLHGPNRDTDFGRLAEFDLVLTTYPLLPRDRAILLEQCWHYLILDEAQQIKNPRAQAAQVVRKLNCRHRLCLTGTPLENHLGELWAQFDLLFDLLPQLLEEGRRVLLFSQFTTMLGLIARELDHRGIDYAKLTGQTRKRDAVIQRFRDGEVALFLISLKAGD